MAGYNQDSIFKIVLCNLLVRYRYQSENLCCELLFGHDIMVISFFYEYVATINITSKLDFLIDVINTILTLEELRKHIYLVIDSIRQRNMFVSHKSCK